MSGIAIVRMRRMHTLRGVHYAHVTHLQITWYRLYIIFRQSQFPTQCDRLSQQQLGFFFDMQSRTINDCVL